MSRVSWTDAQLVGWIGHMQNDGHAVKIASISYSVKRNDPKPWVLRTGLPGWVNARHFETIDGAQDACERILLAFAAAIVGPVLADRDVEIDRLKSIIGDMPIGTGN